MQTDYANFVIVLAAPSGVGKDTVCAELIRRDPQMVRAVSVTTRERRAEEQEGVHYFFRSKAEFEQMLQRGEILEYGQDFDNYYGTLKGFLPEEQRRGKEIIKVIEIQGLRQLKTLLPKESFISIYLIPPSLAETKRRLEARQRDTAEDIAKRMSHIKEKIADYQEFDYVVVNDVLETAVQEILSIIAQERARRQHQQQIQQLVEQLLQESY